MKIIIDCQVKGLTTSNVLWLVQKYSDGYKSTHLASGKYEIVKYMDINNDEAVFIVSNAIEN